MLRYLVIIGGISCTWTHMAKSMAKVKRKRYKKEIWLNRCTVDIRFMIRSN